MLFFSCTIVFLLVNLGKCGIWPFWPVVRSIIKTEIHFSSRKKPLHITFFLDWFIFYINFLNFVIDLSLNFEGAGLVISNWELSLESLLVDKLP